MRKELERIRQIEMYLEDKMSEQERLAFESKINADDYFKQELMIQKEIVDRLSGIEFKKDIESYHRHYITRLFYKKVLMIALSAVIGAVIIGFFIYKKNHPKTEQEVVPVNEKMDTPNEVVKKDSVEKYNKPPELTKSTNDFKNEKKTERKEQISTHKEAPVVHKKQTEVVEQKRIMIKEAPDELDRIEQTVITTDISPEDTTFNILTDDNMPFHDNNYSKYTNDSLSITDFPLVGKLKDGNRIFYFVIDEQVNKVKFEFRFSLKIGTYSYIIKNPRKEAFSEDGPTCGFCINSIQTLNKEFAPMVGIWSIEIKTTKISRGKYRLNVIKD